MSYIILSCDISQETKKQYRQRIIECLHSRAEHEWNNKEISKGGNIRQITAKDLGLQSWQTPPQKAAESTVWINSKTKPMQFIAITGIVQLSENPKISNVIIRGNSGTTMHDIDELYSILPIIKKLETYKEDDELFQRFGEIENIKMAAYFSEPYIFHPDDVIHITVRSPEGNETGDKLMLSGFIMEPQE